MVRTVAMMVASLAAVMIRALISLSWVVWAGESGRRSQLSGLRVEGDCSRVVGQLRRDGGRDVGPAVQDGSAGGRELPGLVGHQPGEHGGEP